MKNREEIIKRLEAAKDKQIKTGFAERNPVVHEKLLLKIKALKDGKRFEIKDVTVKYIAEYGGAFPLMHTFTEISSIVDSEETKKIKALMRLKHINKQENEYNKAMEKYSNYKNTNEWEADLK